MKPIKKYRIAKHAGLLNKFLIKIKDKIKETSELPLRNGLKKCYGHLKLEQLTNVC